MRLALPRTRGAPCALGDPSSALTAGRATLLAILDICTVQASQSGLLCCRRTVLRCCCCAWRCVVADRDRMTEIRCANRLLRSRIVPATCCMVI